MHSLTDFKLGFTTDYVQGICFHIGNLQVFYFEMFHVFFLLKPLVIFSNFKRIDEAEGVLDLAGSRKQTTHPQAACWLQELTPFYLKTIKRKGLMVSTVIDVGALHTVWKCISPSQASSWAVLTCIYCSCDRQHIQPPHCPGSKLGSASLNHKNMTPRVKWEMECTDRRTAGESWRGIRPIVCWFNVLSG